MGIVSIPVRLTLSESSAVALTMAADELAAACDAPNFLAALDTNHRLWLTLSDIAHISKWTVPDRRLSDFVMTTSHKAGRKTGDDLIETLIGINREVSSKLAGNQNMDAIQRRATLAWEERGRPYGHGLERWLIAEMERKARIRH